MYYFINRKTGMRKSQGFSLIELMIAVVIIGILASIAIPNYRQYMTRTGRSDAIQGFSRMAPLMEGYYKINKTYTNDPGDLGYGDPATSPEGYYAITIPVANTNGYTLVATAVTPGPQADDTPCLTMTLTSAGQKTPAECW